MKRILPRIFSLLTVMNFITVSAQSKLDYSGFQQVFPDSTNGLEYLYQAEYKDYDYEAALNMFHLLVTDWGSSTLSTVSLSDLATLFKLTYQGTVNKRNSCAEVRKGHFMGRNLDGYYNDYCNLVMRIDSADGRLASIGVGRMELIGAKKVFDNSALLGSVMNCVPMFTNDGINSAGVCVGINSLPVINMTRTTSTNPGKPRLCMAVLPRLILDKAHSVDEALSMIQNDYDIFAPHNETFDVYRELHILIADSVKTAIVEFFDNKVNVQISTDINNMNATYDAEGNLTKPDVNIMTNFWQTQMDNDSLCRGGVERYRMLYDHYNDVSSETATADDVYDLLSTAWLSKSFYDHYNQKQTYWITDLLWETPWCDLKPGSTSVTGQAEKELMMNVMDMFAGTTKPELLKKYRPSIIEGTLHTAVYDTKAKSMMLVPIESDKKLYYDFK